MKVFPPYSKDYELYFQVDEEDRWIFNKLEICRRFGYGPAGPCGTKMPTGTYCVRPIINVLGMGQGGFWKHRVFKDNDRVNRPGYCWTPWSDEPRAWVEYVDGKVSSALRQISWDEGSQRERYIEWPADKAHPLPKQLKNISRYMLVEYLGDMIIDIGPRHMSEDAKLSVVADYKKFDPTYDVEANDTYAPHMKRITLDNGGYGWEELEIFVPRVIYK